MGRRRALRLLGGASLLPILGCGDDPAPGGAGGSGGQRWQRWQPGAVDRQTPPASTCTVIPEETGGPYPGDGINGPNVLTVSGVVRSDIRTSIGSASGTAAGVPLTIKLTLVNTGAACAPLAGRAIYLWHCDREGNYSMYTGAATAQNYLRGVQETDASGKATFVSIFPACYSGRWPHIHFEIYPSLATAMAAANRISDLPARPARGHLQHRLRHRRLRHQRHQPAAASPSPTTTSSATAAPSSWPPPPAAWPPATPRS